MDRRTGLRLVEIVVLLFVVLLAVGIVLPMRAVLCEGSKRHQCVGNVNQLAKAMYMYADVPANNGYFPTGGGSADPYADPTPMIPLNLLYGYLIDSRVFSCPETPLPPQIQKGMGKLPLGGIPLTRASCSYGYDPGHKPEQQCAVLADKPNGTGNSLNHGTDGNGNGVGQNVVHADGTVEWMASPMRAAGTSGVDDNIFKLDPGLPREMDSYIRQ